MAIAKTEEFTRQEQQLAGFAKALSHPARIAILKVLAKQNECICGKIVAVLPLAQSTVSQHLKELKNAGLIKGDIEGNSICYCINEKALEAIQKYFVSLSARIEKKKTNCC